MPRVCALACLACCTPGALAAAESEGRSPAETLQSFRLAAGFRIELVAAEPDVQDPVAIAWDERGRLWVAEMADYPSAAGGGRIRVLEDRDGDGRVDASRVAHAGLPFVAGLLPLRGGLLAASAPHLLLLDDQGSRPVLTGFGEGNTQLSVNGLQWGMDGRIHGANGRSGGRIRRPEDPETAAIDIAGRDFRVDPVAWRPEAIAGPSQFGHAFDAWGRRFLSWNTIHIRQDLLSPRDLERHPRLQRTATVAHISDHEDSSRVFRLTPPPRTFNQEPIDHFNASCGLTIECGGLFPPTHAGGAFLCEPLLGVVHRDVLIAGPGPALVAHRGEEGAEFLASTDPWFHPVYCRSGPDGALYVVDFYRELVEHPDFVRPELRVGVDFGRGRGHGRLWRIVPEGAALLPVEDLGRLDRETLAARLESANGRVRETAQRLLLESREAAAVPRLASLAQASTSPVARAWALWTLHRLGALEVPTIRGVLDSREPRLREAALRLVRDLPRPIDAALVAPVLAATLDPDPGVRLQAALAAGDLAVGNPDRDVPPALGRVARTSVGDPWLLAAVASGSRGRELAVLAAFLRPIAELPRAPFVASFAHELATLAPPGDASRPGTQDILLSRELIEAGRREVALAIAAGRGEHGDPAPPALAGLALESARDLAAPRESRLWAIRCLAYASGPEPLAALSALVDPRQDLEIARAGARALGAHVEEAAAEALLAAWPRSTPGLRGALLEGLLGRAGRGASIARALGDGRIVPRDLDAAQRELLLRSLGGAERGAIAALLDRGRPAGSTRRAAVVARAIADATPGDEARGSEVFTVRCAPCHRLDGRGHAVGPDLAGARRKSREELLAAILDPNQSTVPGYGAYAAVREDGRVTTGVLAGETAEAVTLRRAEGIEETILRTTLRELEAMGVSLMPEGLEAELTPQALADLLAYLRASRS